MMLGGTLLLGCAKHDTITVTYLTPDTTAAPLGIRAFFAEHDFAELQVMQAKDFSATGAGSQVLWVNAPDTSSWILFQAQSSHLYPALQRAADNGADVLFTGYAALLPHELGWESAAPEVRSNRVENNWFFARMRGLQSLLGHPVFADGLFGGAYIWDPGDSTVVSTVGFYGDTWPVEGKVVGVQKRYVNQDSKAKQLLEYDLPGGGTALSLGGWFDLERDNRMRFRADRFLSNSLRYLDGDTLGVSPTWWTRADSLIRELPPPEFVDFAARELPSPADVRFDSLAAPALTIEQDDPGENWFSLGGRQTLVMGDEQGGISEAWAFPFRLFQNLRTTVLIDDREIDLSQRTCDDLLIHPESIRRTWQFPEGTLTEQIFPSLDKSGVVLHYQWDGKKRPGEHATTYYGAKVNVDFETDLRWMWPYDADALGALRYRTLAETPAVHVTDERGQLHLVAGCDRTPNEFGITELDHRIVGPYESINHGYEESHGVGENQQRVLISLGRNLALPNRATFVIAGSNKSLRDAYATYFDLVSDPRAAYDQAANHYTTLLDSMTSFDTPDDEFDRLWKWTLVGIDRFRITTPGLGTALMAGFGTREKGWDGNQISNGRPGYGWYFGRDAVWSAFAIDDYGDFATVREQLEFLRRYQDLDGKIFHELTASGAIHYDAADSTPLYILLAAHYLQHSGDVEYLRDLYPSLLAAVDFLNATDSDGDLLIENENVGHGWVEGGSLWGSQTSIYLAGLWARALEDMAYIADRIGEEPRAKMLRLDALDVFNQIDAEFWSNDHQFYSFGKLPDGSFNPERTILPATVAWFNSVDPSHMNPVLDAYASDEFTTDWGVSILSTQSEHYNPRAYHGGAVWPLFTGWASLAEYKYGRPLSGFTHIWENMAVKHHWSLGYVEEVLHGEEYKPYGVCPHQCWSETNIAQPTLAGMLGWAPDATLGFARLAPQFPADWDTVTVRNLRVGDSRFDLRMERRLDSSSFPGEQWLTTWTFTLTHGHAFILEFAPGFAPGTSLDWARLGGAGVELIDELEKGVLATPITVDVNGEMTLQIATRGGLSMLPVTPTPQPGEQSRGNRIIRQWVDSENRYHVLLEGRSGQTGSFRLRSFAERAELRCEGGTVSPNRSSDGGLHELRVRFPSSADTFSRREVVITAMR